jgi:hypothetical protein
MKQMSIGYKVNVKRHFHFDIEKEISDIWIQCVATNKFHIFTEAYAI